MFPKAKSREEYVSSLKKSIRVHDLEKMAGKSAIVDHHKIKIK